jgi:hypothetical protein
MTQVDNGFSEELTEAAIKTIRETAMRLRRPLNDAEISQLLTLEK